VEIRDARHDDVAALGRLASGHALFARYGLDAPGLGRSLSAALTGGDGLLVAVDERGPLAFAWWVPAGAFARSPYLRLLVVAPEATGGGIGGALLDAVETRAAPMGHDLFLLVTHDNAAAQRFYGRRGYAEVGRLPDYVVTGITEIVLRKRLAPVAARPLSAVGGA
jgi:[ribosomal protein S18]-alanine N-acetyltransferase